MLPVTQQLDAVRKEIDSATARSRAFDAEVATLSDELSRSTDRQQRAGLESAIRGVGAEHNRVELQLQQARARENDLSRTLALEEVHWNDALSRLEQLTR
jgi:predicted  nucleic acid-binding Zn-ribbon protein